MAKKQIIWSSDYYMNDEAREDTRTHSASFSMTMDIPCQTAFGRKWSTAISPMRG